MSTWLRLRVEGNQTLSPLLKVWHYHSSWNERLDFITFCGVEVWLTAKHIFMLLEIERYLRHDEGSFAYEREHLDLLLASVKTLLSDPFQLPEVIVYLAQCARINASAAGVDPSLIGDALIDAIDQWVCVSIRQRSENPSDDNNRPTHSKSIHINEEES